MQCELLVTLPAAGIKPAPAACAAVHTSTPHQLSAASCYATRYATNDTYAMQPKPYAMQPCNIATGATCNYTNAVATFPTSETSCYGVWVSQHKEIGGRCASWRYVKGGCCQLMLHSITMTVAGVDNGTAHHRPRREGS